MKIVRLWSPLAAALALLLLLVLTARALILPEDAAPPPEELRRLTGQEHGNRFGPVPPPAERPWRLAAERGAGPRLAAVIPAEPADLALAKTVIPTTAEEGETITFVLELTNGGPGPAAGILVRDLLPPGLTLLAADSTNHVPAYDPVTGLWQVNELPPGELRNLRLLVRADEPGDHTNVAEIIQSSAPDPDSVPGNNDPAEDDQAAVFFQVRPGIPRRTCG